MTEPPAMANRPRYSARAFPAYCFVPGQTPHPRRHPQGHSFGLAEPRPLRFNQDEWSASEDYLYAVDLYNFAYWWESHEVFEGLWHAFGRKTQEGIFFQALIQFAAANLKYVLGKEAATANLSQRGLERLQKVPPHYMGIDLAAFADSVRRWLDTHRYPYVPIQLDISAHSLPSRGLSA